MDVFLLVLSDETDTRLFIFSTDDTDHGFVAFRLTSLALVPLPASSLMLIGGLAGLGAIARRKRRG